MPAVHTWRRPTTLLPTRWRHHRPQVLSKSDRSVTLLSGGRLITLSAEKVLATARREIARGLPPAAHNFQSWVVEVDGQQVGVKWLFGLATGMSHADFKTRRPTPKLNQARRAFEHLGLAVHRIEDTTANEVAEAISEDHPGELSKLEFIEKVGVVLDGLLVGAGLTATLKTPWDQLVQVHFAAFSGCHYEIWVHAHTIEVGLHFQTSRKLNYARLEWFHPHRDLFSATPVLGLKRQLGLFADIAGAMSSICTWLSAILMLD